MRIAAGVSLWQTGGMESDPGLRRASFWEHLEELRWVLFRCLAVLGLTTTIGFGYASRIAGVLRRPLNAVEPAVELVFSAPLDALVSRLHVALLVGLLLGAPWMVYWIWLFVAPGLTSRERHVVRWALWVGSVFFGLGLVFAYHVLSMGLSAMVRFGLGGTRHLWSMHSYLVFCVRFLLAFGVVFELPVVLVALGRMGLLQAESLRVARPYVVVGLFVLAAVLTPPDPITQVLLALPLLLLYELAILAVRWLQRPAA